jgi:hypothetical protein
MSANAAVNRHENLLAARHQLSKFVPKSHEQRSRWFGALSDFLTGGMPRDPMLGHTYHSQPLGDLRRR